MNERVTRRLSSDRVIPGFTRDVPANSASVVSLIVAGETDSENVSVIVEYGPRPVAPSVGVTVSNVGAVVSAADPVVNCGVRYCNGLPARSVICEV